MITADLNEASTYQQLCLLIDEFEKAALKSQTREGILAVMNGPLDSMDHVLAGADGSLANIQQVRGRSTKAKSAPSPTMTARTSEQTGGSTTAKESDDGLEVSKEPFNVLVEKQTRDGAVPLPPSVKLEGGLKLDADLAEIFGDDAGDAAAIKAYLKDCLGCDSRISFDWQLPAFDLLGPISDMVNEINASLDRLEKLTDPTELLAGFCKAMNDFQIICIPDWTMILMSLKMLMRKYLSFNLSVKLDWTIVLGPLLSVIADGISSLIHQVAGVVFAPIDCAISTLKTFEKLELEAKETFNTAKTTTKGAADYAKEVAQGQFLPDATYTSKTRDLNEKNGRLSSSVRNSDDPQNKNAWASVWSGFDLESKRNLTSEIEKVDGTLVGLLVAAVEEARDFIDELVMKINSTVKSVKGLVGGGLSIQLQSLGYMTLILQLIRVIIMIINLLRSGIKPNDWCTYLEEHPDIFEDALKRAVDPKATVNKGKVTVSGRTTELKTCVSGRTSIDKNILNQWILDLGRAS